MESLFVYVQSLNYKFVYSQGIMELPRGMKDFGSEEIKKIEFVRERFLETCRIFGFEFMEPSPIELLSVLEAKSGSAIRDDIYYFQDKAQRDIALRFDFTVGLTRFIASQKSMRLPAKLASFGGVWRYDEPQKGRYRFFHQWNIELYGKSNLEYDSETIEFTSRLFDSLGMKDVVINISHRRLAESMIHSIFDSADGMVISDMLRAIDKIGKKSRKEITDEFVDKGYDSTNIEKLLDFSLISGSPDEISKLIDTTKLESWDEILDIWNSLENRNVRNARINFGIVRGLDYYTGTVFEVIDPKSDLGSLAGGGRYDSLPSAFRRDDLGAVGVAGGVERTILAMDNQSVLNISRNVPIRVVYVDNTVFKHAIHITSQLRSAKIPTVMDLTDRAFKKQFTAAKESLFVVIVGPKEYENNQVKIKNMKNEKEELINIDSLTQRITTLLSS